MARGWESKSVESQQQAAESREPSRPAQTVTELRIQSLEKTRKHILSEIEASTNPRFRQLKGKALTFIEAQIRELKG